MSGWWGSYSFRCQPVDYSNDPMALRVSSNSFFLKKDNANGICCRWPELVGGTIFQNSPNFLIHYFLFYERKIVTCQLCMLSITVVCLFPCGWE